MNLKSVLLILGVFAFSSHASNERVALASPVSECEVHLLESINSSIEEQRVELMNELMGDFKAELSKLLSNFVIDGLDVTNQSGKQLLSE
tara:strand:+ start:230 stop:499 length:270 start_codon:yes stop_codon:yes gene_type:complete